MYVHILYIYIFIYTYGGVYKLGSGYETAVNERRRNTNHGDCRGVEIVG